MRAYQEAVKETRELARRQGNAVLSTLSVEMAGWPFGSVAPYVLDQSGNPILLLSDLAQHTHNLLQDDRASLIVFEPEQVHIEEGARATLLGRVTVIEGEESIRDRYLRYLPQAAQYLAIHDFRFYRLMVERVRYIGGFGSIHWLRGEDYRLAIDEGDFSSAETGAVTHMNGDHRDALVRYCQMLGVDEPQPVLLGVDPEGFDMQARARRLRMRFRKPVTNPSEWRGAFKALLAPPG
ncbi:MAG: DUF2470 domain-containing protein [Gammaproteobacteria bacterium]|nr:DUF2470 domain-containing protein [Gammaproteobacteria bacterium]